MNQDEDLSPAQKRARLQQAMDEGITVISSNHPVLWRALFVNLQVQGFDEDHAFSLVKAYILSQAPAGVHVHRN